MYKRYLPVTLLAALCLVAAAYGYLAPEPRGQTPVRVLFDNSGGKVVFHHLRHHRDYRIPCTECHHESGPGKGTGAKQEPLPCGSCHPASFDKNYVRDHVNSFPDGTYCIKCHHAEFGSLAYDHEAHKEFAGGDCEQCHHPASIEPEPQSCKNCHTLAGNDAMPSVRQAAHDRCEQCHEDMFEDGMKGCRPCHKLKDMHSYMGPYTPCKQCHQDASKDLILTRTNAFHDQCMDCHKKEGKGPYGDKDCAKCHISR